MDETQITAQLQQRVPRPYEPDLPEPDAPPVDPPQPITDGSTPLTPAELDEITQYKLHDYFNIHYRTTDDMNKQQAQYIFDRVAEMIGDRDYGFVVAKIRDLEGIIGTQNSDNRMYKLYQWLKLEGMRRSIDAQMGAIR